MDIIFIGGMIERKLESKILPLQECSKIDKIFLVRKKKYTGKKIYNYNAPDSIKDIYFLSEILRVFQVIWIIIRYRPKYIIAAGLIPHGIYASVLSRIFFRKSILLLMGELEFPLTCPPDTIKQKILTFFVKNFDAIGVRGSNSERKLKNIGYSKKTFIANNVFSFDDFYPLKKNKQYDFIFIGNIAKEKRLDILLEILYRIKTEKKHNLKGVIIGEGKLKSKLMEQAKAFGLDGVKFLPFMEKSDLNKYLNKSKIFLLTSEYEGLPMVLVESLACGVPAVSFNIADISDIITNGYNGYLVDFGDIENFKERCYTLLSNKILYNKFSEACLESKHRLKHIYSVEYNKLIWNNILL